MTMMTAFRWPQCIFLLDSQQPLFVIIAAAGCMSFPMSLEARHAGVALAARIASVRFFTVMHMRVELHVHPLGVVPATGWAAVRLFACVQSEMGLEI